jgi:hypothetical protein
MRGSTGSCWPSRFNQDRLDFCLYNMPLDVARSEDIILKSQCDGVEPKISLLERRRTQSERTHRLFCLTVGSDFFRNYTTAICTGLRCPATMQVHLSSSDTASSVCDVTIAGFRGCHTAISCVCPLKAKFH